MLSSSLVFNLILAPKTGLSLFELPGWAPPNQIPGLDDVMILGAHLSGTRAAGGRELFGAMLELAGPKPVPSNESKNQDKGIG